MDRSREWGGRVDAEHDPLFEEEEEEEERERPESPLGTEQVIFMRMGLGLGLGGCEWSGGFEGRGGGIVVDGG